MLKKRNKNLTSFPPNHVDEIFQIQSSTEKHLYTNLYFIEHSNDQLPFSLKMIIFYPVYMQQKNSPQLILITMANLKQFWPIAVTQFHSKWKQINLRNV